MMTKGSEGSILHSKLPISLTTLILQYLSEVYGPVAPWIGN